MLTSFSVKNFKNFEKKFTIDLSNTKQYAYSEACVKDGIPISGYLYWSLLDNFEWQRGYSMTFGLVEVDRKTQRRTAKPSLFYLGSFAKSC